MLSVDVTVQITTLKLNNDSMIMCCYNDHLQFEPLSNGFTLLKIDKVAQKLAQMTQTQALP